ncbi:hypothetical protein K488DRAFT_87235 [Vararia minispora EC-137]|uniref:Uncharacterized protein n=1 Tax=Vararia minispora EC-137 TaxID=1314806 RepID=A0ACB8QHA3_9AGAM|nr:hypothetical protein K488DRAFT_87235 [Vararia minispora EC-137]
MGRFPTTSRPTLFVRATGESLFHLATLDDWKFPCLRLIPTGADTTVEPWVELVRRDERWITMRAADGAVHLFGRETLLNIDGTRGPASLRDALMRAAHYFTYLTCRPSRGLHAQVTFNIHCATTSPASSFDDHDTPWVVGVAKGTSMYRIQPGAAYVLDVTNHYQFDVYAFVVLFDQHMSTTIVFDSMILRAHSVTRLYDRTHRTSTIIFDRRRGRFQYVRIVISSKPMVATGFIYDRWLADGRAPQPEWDALTFGVDLA